MIDCLRRAQPVLGEPLYINLRDDAGAVLDAGTGRDGALELVAQRLT
jgi:hypothetical protein